MDELNTLSKLYAKRDLLLSEITERRRKILEMVQPQLEALEEETNPMLKAVGEKIAIVEDRVKSLVITQGESVKGFGLHLVYTKGRVSWETKMLEGMALLFPEINKAKKIGEPSVSIKRI